MSTDDIDSQNYWRAIILYGLNTATYKIALGHCLAGFVQQGSTRVSTLELAEAFFDLYLKRLESGKPQLVLPNRMTVMERTVQRYRSDNLARDEAVNLVERYAFIDVIPRFHVVNNTPVPTLFYEHNGAELILTDHAFEALTGDGYPTLIKELDARWDLLEAAFMIRRENAQLVNDLRSVYLAKGYDRTAVTHLVPVLQGYQSGGCFYCGEAMAAGDIHVDHVIPRQLVFHDEIWNLVLAHGFCNMQKSDALPARLYIEKLVRRNEYFIASNHPIRERLIGELGRTAGERALQIHRAFDEAKVVIRHEWQGIGGYNPATDPFYRTLVRSFAR